MGSSGGGVGDLYCKVRPSEGEKEGEGREGSAWFLPNTFGHPRVRPCLNDHPSAAGKDSHRQQRASGVVIYESGFQ